MVSSSAASVDQYLEQLEPERAEVARSVRDLVNAALPDGYEEAMAWGMITWSIPLEHYPDTYNKQPLAYVSLAAQKNHFSLYLNCVYASPERTNRLRSAFEAAGKTLDMGKSCIRFKRRSDLADDAISAEIASASPAEFIEIYEGARSSGRGC